MTTARTSLQVVLMLTGGLLLGRCGSTSIEPDAGCVGTNCSGCGEGRSWVECWGGGYSTCPVLGGTAVSAAVGARSVLISVSQVSRGPQLGHGASVFNVVAHEAERCAPVTDGPCVVRDCRPPPDHIGDMGAPLTGWSLGRVTVRDRIDPMAEVAALMPQANGTYARPDGTAGARWRADDEICVGAVGGGLREPFQAPVLFPLPLRYIGPMVPDAINQIVYIERRSPLALRWEPTSERVAVTLGQRPANGTTPTWLEEITASCSFDGTRGVGEIPPSVLGRFLSAPENNSSGSLTVVSQRQSRVLVGDTLVQVNASAGLSFRAEFR
jgi:hypothetical protein